jgi:hypothetical protein
MLMHRKLTTRIVAINNLYESCVIVLDSGLYVKGSVRQLVRETYWERVSSSCIDGMCPEIMLALGIHII